MGNIVSNLPCLLCRPVSPPPPLLACVWAALGPQPSCDSGWKPHISSLTVRQQSRECPVPSSLGKSGWWRAADAQSQGHVPLKCWAGEKPLSPCCLWPGRGVWMERVLSDENITASTWQDQVNLYLKLKKKKRLGLLFLNSNSQFSFTLKTSLGLFGFIHSH